MKKILTVILALAVVFCGVASVRPAMLASAKVSPTAPTIKPPPTVPDNPSDPSGPHDPTEHDPTNPTNPTKPTSTNPTYTVPTSYGTPSGGVIDFGGGTSGSVTPGGSTPTTGNKPGIKPGVNFGDETLATTPDGSTITGPATPDKNPDSPKTGDTGAEVFAFAGVVFAGAAVTVLTKKNKKSDDEQ